jgi:hypothetical protein
MARRGRLGRTDRSLAIRTLNVVLTSRRVAAPPVTRGSYTKTQTIRTARCSKPGQAADHPSASCWPRAGGELTLCAPPTSPRILSHRCRDRRLPVAVAVRSFFTPSRRPGGARGGPPPRPPPPARAAGRDPPHDDDCLLPGSARRVVFHAADFRKTGWVRRSDPAWRDASCSSIAQPLPLIASRRVPTTQTVVRIAERSSRAVHDSARRRGIGSHGGNAGGCSDLSARDRKRMERRSAERHGCAIGEVRAPGRARRKGATGLSLRCAGKHQHSAVLTPPVVPCLLS